MAGSDAIVIACDVGGTRIKLGLVQSGRLLARNEIDSAPREGMRRVLRDLEIEIKRLCRKAALPGNSLAGMGMAFPGIVDPETGRILSTPAGKFDDARQMDIAREIRRRIGIPVLVSNDANAALMGEWKLGAVRGYHSAVMLTLGTGIGTSAIIEGKPLRGRHGQAGCLGGHITVNLEGENCPCGNIGCAETEASTWVLSHRAARHPLYASSRLARIGKKLDYAAIFKWADAGDSVAVSLRNEAIDAWSTVLVTLIHAYDPECAVIGGGIMASGPFILKRMRRYAARHAWTPWGRVRIKAAALGNDAGMLGAAALMMERL